MNHKLFSNGKLHFFICTDSSVIILTSEIPDDVALVEFSDETENDDELTVALEKFQANENVANITPPENFM